MFKLIQFSLNAEVNTRVLAGSEPSMRRAYNRAVDFALLTGACLHLQLIDPRGQVVEAL